MKDEESIYVLEKGSLHEVLDLKKKGENEKLIRQIKVLFEFLYINKFGSLEKFSGVIHFSQEKKDKIPLLVKVFPQLLKLKSKIFSQLPKKIQTIT